MSSDSPRNSSDINELIKSRISALDQLKDSKETLTIEWRGAQIHIPVISMPVEILTYNPDTHRIRAQLSTKPELELDLINDPWGASAQNYLHNLLMGDPADPTKIDPSFTALKEDLREHGQNDPGIITRAGVLINGNTRRAALKEINSQNIRVGVLPPDAAHDDIQSIELSLQLRRDHRRDYSFMNFLLAIDERIRLGQTAVKIQKDFRIRASVYDRSRWILDFVKSAIARSEIMLDNGKKYSLSLVEFEAHQGKLEELYGAYISLAPKSPDDASALVEQRLIALLLGKSKTDLRLVGPDFVAKYMPNEMPTVSSSAPLNIPGTPITVAGPDNSVLALRKLADEILRVRSISSAEHINTEAIISATNRLKSIDDSLVKGLNYAGKQTRVQKRKFAAPDRISEANECIGYAIEAVAAARSSSDFSSEDLDEVLLTLKSRLEKLAAIIKRGSDTSLDGIAWLQHAAEFTPDEE
jgi:hypothetical protein